MIRGKGGTEEEGGARIARLSLLAFVVSPMSGTWNFTQAIFLSGGCSVQSGRWYDSGLPSPAPGYTSCGHHDGLPGFEERPDCLARSTHTTLWVSVNLSWIPIFELENNQQAESMTRRTPHLNHQRSDWLKNFWI